MKHAWPKDPQRFTDPETGDGKSERECARPGCHTVKVTRHVAGEHWVEFYRDGICIAGANDKTPPCLGTHDPLHAARRAARPEGVPA